MEKASPSVPDITKNKLGENMTHKINQIAGNWKEKLDGIGFRPDVLFFLILLAVLNVPLLGKGFDPSFIFRPAEIESGQWWRLFTHPFVHLSFYHLLLDAGAFFLLYMGLYEQSVFKKILYVVSCGISSLTAALMFSPDIYAKGLCGLSGIAHGLMAVSALEMMQKSEKFRAGFISLTLVVGKCVYEMVSGHAMFLFMHMGLCGTPLVACHVGGVGGGMIVFILFHITNRDSLNPILNMRLR